MSKDFKMDESYVEVAERVVQFRAQFPDGTLQSEIIRWPEEGFPFVAVKVWAYRTPDDPRPGVGLAWENFPGRTPYTKDSELMNAETSAWGRALIAVGAADAKRGIASAQEVRRVKQPNTPKPSATPPADQSTGAVSTSSEPSPVDSSEVLDGELVEETDGAEPENPPASGSAPTADDIDALIATLGRTAGWGVLLCRKKDIDPKRGSNRWGEMTDDQRTALYAAMEAEGSKDAA